MMKRISQSGVLVLRTVDVCEEGDPLETGGVWLDSAEASVAIEAREVFGGVFLACVLRSLALFDDDHLLLLRSSTVGGDVSWLLLGAVLPALEVLLEEEQLVLVGHVVLAHSGYLAFAEANSVTCRVSLELLHNVHLDLLVVVLLARQLVDSQVFDPR